MEKIHGAIITLSFIIFTKSYKLENLKQYFPDIKSVLLNNNRLVIEMNFNPLIERKILQWLLDNEIDFSLDFGRVDIAYYNIFGGENI
jgi:hypothetical protein